MLTIARFDGRTIRVDKASDRSGGGGGGGGYGGKEESGATPNEVDRMDHGIYAPACM